MLNNNFAKPPFQCSSIEDLKGKSVCITPLNGISMLLHHVLTKSGINVVCICDIEPIPVLVYRLKAMHSMSNSIEKYNISQTKQVCREYPNAVYIIADNRCEDFLKDILQNYGISQIVSAFQILEAGYERDLTKGILCADLNDKLVDGLIGYAQIEMRLFLLRKQGREMIGDIVISKNNGYMVSYMGENHAADNLSALCALIFEAVTGDKDGYYDNRIKAVISKILPVFSRNENTDKYRLVSCVRLAFQDKWDFKDISKIMSLVISLNQSIGKIEFEVPLERFDLLPDLDYIESLYYKKIRAYASAHRPMFINQDYSIDFIPLDLIGVALYQYERNESFPAIFIHIPKTGGTTIKKIFNISVGPISAQGYKYYDNEKFDKLFKFTIVRNPWDRLVSSFHFASNTKTKIRANAHDNDARELFDIYESGDFKAFVKYFIKEDRLSYVTEWNEPQSFWICDENGKILVDYVGRFEKLQESYEYICKQIGIDCKPLPVLNATNHKPYQEYYDEETIEIVREIYKKDIELFGYEFEYL